MHARHYPRPFAIVAGFIAALLVIAGLILILAQG